MELNQSAQTPGLAPSREQEFLSRDCIAVFSL